MKGDEVDVRDAFPQKRLRTGGSSFFLDSGSVERSPGEERSPWEQTSNRPRFASEELSVVGRREQVRASSWSSSSPRHHRSRVDAFVSSGWPLSEARRIARTSEPYAGFDPRQEHRSSPERRTDRLNDSAMASSSPSLPDFNRLLYTRRRESYRSEHLRRVFPERHARHWSEMDSRDSSSSLPPSAPPRRSFSSGDAEDKRQRPEFLDAESSFPGRPTIASDSRLRSDDLSSCSPLRHAFSTPSPALSTPPDSNVDVASSSPADSSPSTDPTLPVHRKNSRYLREIDRRNILERIQRGEKQAALAKEFQVSRAAICNLNKHRDEVLSRKSENPLAKHPKKPRVKPTIAKARISSKSSELTNNHTMVYEVKSRAMTMLLSMLRDRQTSAVDFERLTNRMIRILMEEALSVVPIKRVGVQTEAGDTVDGVSAEHPPCAIVLGDRRARGLASLIDIFQVLEPHEPVGFIQVASKLQKGNGDHHSMQLPDDMAERNVVLVMHPSETIETLCDALMVLQRHGAVDTRLYIVTLAISTTLIDEIHTQFPFLKVVTPIVVRCTPTTRPTASSSPSSSSSSSSGSVRNDPFIDRMLSTSTTASIEKQAHNGSQNRGVTVTLSSDQDRR